MDCFLTLRRVVHQRVKLEVERTIYDKHLASQSGLPTPILLGDDRVTYCHSLVDVEAVVERLLNASDPEAAREGRRGLIQISSALPQPATSEIISVDSPGLAPGGSKLEHPSDRQNENLHSKRDGERAGGGGPDHP